jgi:hypothetical protein
VAPQRSVVSSIFNLDEHHPGVVLSALVVRVESQYPQFTVTNWLLAIATFVTVLAIWNEYVMLQILAFV